ncbi:unnamed protein product [Parascedosporium putredinis]|uniref:NADP-dependent oxidoreductase domain-containing protein n=1 Tax=Parascedosporium putredinis TaxID=1442378 RepID=A0A9P1GZK9_9PEZI|nr:unnamed protein product [Parascedosporium putredinis]CAI7991866.1 unnamed protein product [Parascedosporium putredinis]
MGATWINEYTQPTIFGLCQKFGLETAEQYIDGYTVYEDGEGQIRKRLDNNQTENASFSVEAPDAEQDPLTAFVMLIAMAAAERDIYRFDNFPAEEDVSLAEWVAKRTKPFGTIPQYVVLADNCLAPLSVSLKVKKGTSAISNSLVAAMPPGTIVLNSPVNAITQVPAGDVYVSTSNGHHYKSRQVILANPTNTYKNIRFSPRLPKSKDTLVSNTKPGIYAKVIMTYSSPWWREAGLVGKFESVTGPICFSWDISDLDAKQYSLAVFVAGKVAAAWHELSEPAQEEAIIEHLARLVGPELATNARDVVEINTVEWTKEEHIWGGPTSAMGPGMLRKYGHALREPFGRLHFAGGDRLRVEGLFGRRYYLWKACGRGEPKTELGRYRTLSSTAGVRVSPLALGAMSLGVAWTEFMGSMDEEQSYKLLDAYVDAGGNFIDTANNYQNEQSEEYIGRWMASRKNRDTMVIATKFTNNYASHRLGVLYLGASDCPAWIVSAANVYAKSHGKTPFSVYQGRWSLMERDFERDIIPMARHFGMALCPWGVLGGAQLQTSKQIEERKKNNEGGRSFFQTEEARRVSEALEKVATEHGIDSIQQIALAYVRQKAKGVNVVPLLGGRKIQQLEDNIAALSIRLTDEQINQIDEIKEFDIGFPMNFVSGDPKLGFKRPPLIESLVGAKIAYED